MADKENRQIKARTFEEQPKRTSEKIKAPVKETENKGVSGFYYYEKQLQINNNLLKEVKSK